MATPTRTELLAHLERLAAEGRPVPCQLKPLLGWTSEDRGEQQAAAALCGPCPLLTPCREYGLANPKEYGVYGGLTDPARQRPRRSTAA